MPAIPILSCEKNPTDEDLWKHGLEITQDWHGDKISPAPRFLLALTPEHLVFLAGRKKRALSHPTANLGEFTPELWKHDVAEFFLMTGDGPAYLEFNLAPSGAWWSGHFRKIRELAATPPLVGVTTRSQNDANSWQALALIPRSSLPPLSSAKGSICFILESPDHLFLTTSVPQPREPDFHQPDDFLPLEHTRLEDLTDSSV